MRKWLYKVKAGLIVRRRARISSFPRASHTVRKKGVAMGAEKADHVNYLN